MKKKTQEEEEKKMKKRRKILSREKIYTCVKFSMHLNSIYRVAVSNSVVPMLFFSRASRGLYAVVPLVKRLICWCHVFSSSALGRSPTLFEV